MPLGKSLDNILDDYFGQTAVDLQPNKNPQNLANQALLIPVAQISLGSFQTRSVFDSSKISKLAKNIAEQGLIQPILVLQKKVTTTTNPEYVLLAGERRLRAVKELNWEFVLAVVKLEDDLTEQQQAMISAMENLEREDLNPLELSHTFRMLMLTQRLDEDGLANLLGNSVQYVKNYLRLLTLGKEVKQALLDRKIGEGLARLLVPLSEEEQSYFLGEILSKDLTVKELQILINKQKTRQKIVVKDANVHQLSPEIISKVERLSSQFPKAKFTCKGTAEKGRIVISWGS